jgi:hypothetical protein
VGVLRVRRIKSTTLGWGSEEEVGPRGSRWISFEQNLFYVSAMAMASLAHDTSLHQHQADDQRHPADAHEGDVPMWEFMSAVDLASRFKGATLDAVESFLRRYRAKYADCFIENEGRKANEPRYLYRVGEVWTDLAKRFGSSAK